MGKNTKRKRTVVNNSIQNEDNSENNFVQIQENQQAVNDATMQQERNVEVAEESERNDNVDANPTMKKKTRGPTKVKRLPSNILNRIDVEFNGQGEPIGDGSVKLSSYLGPLVREHVPVTLDKWKSLSNELKVVLWNSIQARFKLDEEWQKVPIFQQMGCLFRSSKSALVRKIVKAKNEEERLQLKPDNIKNMTEWKKFIELKTTPEFKMISDKFIAMRQKQMPHTCSRRGMARLAEDMKEESNDSSICRVDVWIKSRTKKDGKPVNMVVANTIEKIKNVGHGSHSGSAICYKEDALSQVLGPDWPGRLRGMGRGMTLNKAVWSNIKDKQTIQMQSQISELKAMVQTLMKNQGKESWGEASTHQKAKHEKNHDKCDLLDWCGTDEIVAEGRVMSSDPNELVQQSPLGLDAMKIIIDISRKSDAFLWRPTLGLTRVGEVEGEIVAWPVNRVVLRNIDQFEKEDNESKVSSINYKCKLYDWSGNEVIVAEGRLHSSNPTELVNDLPLGPSAMAVWVDNPKNRNAYLWRPTIGLTRVGEAVGMKVAWPESRVVVEHVNIVPSFTRTVNVDIGGKSGNSMINNKCKLIDLDRNGEIVAEGRVSSTDLTVLVHFIPLGKNAVRVFVDVPYALNARLWRPTFDLKNIEDAIGAPIAWPAEKVITDASSGSQACGLPLHSSQQLSSHCRD